MNIKRNKCSDFASDVDHHADCPSGNPAITQQIMSILLWHFVWMNLGVRKGISGQILVAISITIWPAQSEIRPLLNKLWVDFGDIFRIAMIQGSGSQWFTILIHHDYPNREQEHYRVISYFDQGGLRCLSALVSHERATIFILFFFSLAYLWLTRKANSICRSVWNASNSGHNCFTEKTLYLFGINMIPGLKLCSLLFGVGGPFICKQGGDCQKNAKEDYKVIIHTENRQYYLCTYQDTW